MNNGGYSSNQGCGVGVVESESEGFSTWGVGIAENVNDSNSDSEQTFAHQLWLFVPQTYVSVTLGNLSSLTLQQEMIMAIQKGYSALTCIPSLEGHSRSAASLGLITQPTLCECNRSGLVSLQFPFAHSGWHYRCSVTLATQQWMRVLMGARPLLRNARHRTVIMPVNLHVLGPFKLARVTRQFIVRLKVFSNGYCPLDWNSNPMFYANPLLQKYIQSDMN